MNMKLRKLISIPILIVAMNFLFLILAPEVYRLSKNLIAIIFFNLFVCIDVSIRSISEKRDKYKHPILIASALAFPFSLIIPLYENKFLISRFFSFLDKVWISYIALAFLVLGGAVLIYSRVKLGKYGGPKIVIEQNHRLVADGLYKYIRHPMYLGFLLLFFGFSLSFRSFLFTIIISILLFLLFKSRMDLEEKSLKVYFSDTYIAYLNRTKRLIPFLY